MREGARRAGEGLEKGRLGGGGRPLGLGGGAAYRSERLLGPAGREGWPERRTIGRREVGGRRNGPRAQTCGAPAVLYSVTKSIVPHHEELHSIT